MSSFDIQEKLQDAEEGLEAASRLTEQLDKKEEAIAALKMEGERFQIYRNVNQLVCLTIICSSCFTI